MTTETKAGCIATTIILVLAVIAIWLFALMLEKGEKQLKQNGGLKKELGELWNGINPTPAQKPEK